MTSIGLAGSRTRSVAGGILTRSVAHDRFFGFFVCAPFARATNQRTFAAVSEARYSGLTHTTFEWYCPHRSLKRKEIV